MTDKEFGSLVMGDVVSHGSAPWDHYMIIEKVIKEDNRNVYYRAVNLHGPFKERFVRVQKEWLIISLVKKRKHFISERNMVDRG